MTSSSTLAAERVPVVGEYEPSKRSGKEPDSEGGECSQNAGELAAAEEQWREDEGGGQPVEGEVVPLDDGADRTGDHCASSLAAGIESDAIDLVLRSHLVVHRNIVGGHGVLLWWSRR